MIRLFYGIAKARPNAIWAFYGHSNSHDLGFEGDSSITNRPEVISCRDQIYCVYYLDYLDINPVRLAFLAGCGTAGGWVKGRTKEGKLWQEYTEPKASIAYSFYQQGADAVVGWMDLQYSGKVWENFNYWFWHGVCKKGLSVGRAIERAKERLPWWTRLFPIERRAVMKTKVWGKNVVLYPPGFGN